MPRIASFIFTKLMGWKIEGQLAPAIKKAVLVVAPHTSWHDFFIAIFSRKVLNISINFMAKKELFRFPFGSYFKWMGGVPIDRNSNKNTVQQMVVNFNTRDEFRLALSPEGTRKKVNTWKSGFYFIAQEAKVPIICVAFDYKTKTVKIGQPFTLSGNYEKDVAVLQTFYKNVEGKITEYT